MAEVEIEVELISHTQNHGAVGIEDVESAGAKGGRETVRNIHDAPDRIAVSVHDRVLVAHNRTDLLDDKQIVL